ALLVGPLCQWAIPFFAVKPRATDAVAAPSGPDAEREAEVEAELEAELEGTATPSSPQLDSPAN
ncbi:MAG TPA: hypothetical protein VIP54_11090, partial [Microterricola sp.]